MFFLPVRHCGTPYSKSVVLCIMPNIAFWHPATRQLWSGGSLRVITPRSSPWNMLWSWWFTIIIWIYRDWLHSLARAASFKDPHRFGLNVSMRSILEHAQLKLIMWEWLHSPPDSKNLQKTWFFHENLMEIIAFSWFSLSELTQRSRHAYRRSDGLVNGKAHCTPYS